MSAMFDHRRLWVTRTQPMAETTALRLRALGWTAVVAPVLETRTLAEPDIVGLAADSDVLAFTSRAAVMAYASLRPLRSQRVFVVGDATGQAAVEAGFSQVEGPKDGAGADVLALADRIAAATPRPVRVLNPTAREPAADLAALLSRRGVAARSVPVYETVDTGLTAPPPDLFGVLVHSPKAAEVLTRLLAPPAAAGLTVVAISAAAAGPLRALGFARIMVARQPNDAAMLDQIRDLTP